MVHFHFCSLEVVLKGRKKCVSCMKTYSLWLNVKPVYKSEACRGQSRTSKAVIRYQQRFQPRPPSWFLDCRPVFISGSPDSLQAYKGKNVQQSFCFVLWVEKWLICRKVIRATSTSRAKPHCASWVMTLCRTWLSVAVITRWPRDNLGKKVLFSTHS